MSRSCKFIRGQIFSSLRLIKRKEEGEKRAKKKYRTRFAKQSKFWLKNNKSISKKQKSCLIRSENMPLLLQNSFVAITVISQISVQKRRLGEN